MRAGRLALIVSVGFVLLTGMVLAMRPGYSPDEDITWFVVRGIGETWRPRLPSGLDYWRGPIYSYSLWVFGSIFGFSLTAYRAFSVVLSACALGCTFVVARRISLVGAWIAVILLALMPAFVANAASARFYPALIAASTAALAALVTRRSIAVYFAAAAAARLSHELGIAVLTYPAAAWLCGYELHSSFRKRSNVLIATATLIALHFALVSLQRTGIGGEAAAAEGAWLGMPVPAFGMWPIVQVARWQDWLIVSALALAAWLWLRRRGNAVDAIFIAAIAAAAAVFSAGGIIAASLLWLLSDSGGKRRHLLIAAAFAASSWICWAAIVSLRTDIFMTRATAIGLLTASIRANLDGVEFLIRDLPGASAFIALAAAMAIFKPPSDARRLTRFLTMVFLVYVLAFGIFGTDPRTRFIAVAAPLIALLAAACVSAFDARRAAMAAAAVLMISGVITEQQRFVAGTIERPTTQVSSPWSAWFPAVGLEHPFDSELPRPEPSEIVFTNDELAALLTLGKSNYWLAPDDYFAQFYGRRSPNQFEGIYAGSRVLTSDDQLRTVLAAISQPATIVWFRSGKFGGVPQSFSDTAVWPPGSTFRSTPDWAMIRVPAR